jgi:small-conductance mechanosensitive channel
MFTKLRGLLDRNVLTALAIGLIVAFILISFIAALTGHYDSASVRAWIDDVKWVAALLGGGTAIARGLIAAGQRVADGTTEAALVVASPVPTASTAPPPEADVPGEPPVQPSQSGLT